jgi:lipid A 3-O-deacylase
MSDGQCGSTEHMLRTALLRTASFCRAGILIGLLLGAIATLAQEAKPIHEGTFEFGVWAGGGTGVGERSRTKFFNTGVRLGKVLTPDFGPSFLHGNFEFVGDIVPLWLIWQDSFRVRPASAVPGAVAAGLDPSTPVAVFQRERVYGGSFHPVILKWNFTRSRRVVPYIAAEGGVLVTKDDVPFPDTSNVNFTPGGDFGLQIFTKQRQAAVFSVHVTHISNASMGDHNPGVNASVLFRLGYHWYK